MGLCRCAGNRKTSRGERDGRVVLRYHSPPLLYHPLFERGVSVQVYPCPHMAIRSVFRAAAYYDRELARHSLLILYLDDSATVQTCTVSFAARNFMHLTGLSAVRGKPCSSKHFYHLALNKRLSYRDADHLMGITSRTRLITVEAALKHVLYADRIGTYNHAGPLLFTEPILKKLSPCIGFKRDRSTGAYLPNVLIQVDPRRKLPELHKVCAIFRKRDGETEYTELTHIADDVTWDGIVFPEKIQYLKDLVVQVACTRRRLAERFKTIVLPPEEAEHAKQAI